MRIIDWSSDVCSSDLFGLRPVVPGLVSPPLTSGQFSYEPENDYHHLRASFSRKIAWNGDFSLTATGGRMSPNDYIVAPMTCQGQFGLPVIPGALYAGDNWQTTDALSRTPSDLGIDPPIVNPPLVLQPTD